MPYSVSYDCHTCGCAFSVKFRMRTRAPDVTRCSNCGCEDAHKILSDQEQMSYQDRHMLIESAASARRRGQGDKD